MGRFVAKNQRHNHSLLFHSRKKLKIGLVGGSFNPAHDGHVHMSCQALNKLRLDQVWWLVSPQNPLKSKTNMADLNQRLITARNHVAAYPFIHVFAPETSLPSTYTYKTVQYLKKTMSLAYLVWIMGADNLIQLPQWKRYKALIYSLPIAVIDRPSYSYEAVSAGRKMFKRRYTSSQLRCKLSKTPLNLPAWCFITGPKHHASATAIRNKIP